MTLVDSVSPARRGLGKRHRAKHRQPSTVLWARPRWLGQFRSSRVTTL